MNQIYNNIINNFNNNNKPNVYCVNIYILNYPQISSPFTPIGLSLGTR